MSGSKTNEKILDDEEDDWAFVDMQGTVIEKEETEISKKPNTEKTAKRKKPTSPNKREVEPDFEVIHGSGLTMSTIVATTEVEPMPKDTSDGEEGWGIVTSTPISDPGPDLAQQLSPRVNIRVEPKAENSNLDDVEFIQIPDSSTADCDTSSTSSFDVIDENKGALPVSETVGNVDNDIDYVNDETANSDVTGDIETIESKHRLEILTVFALLCLATVAGFVTGHGVGITTGVWVIKTPKVKPLTNVQKPEANVEQSQNSQLEGKMQKWKSMYRNGKQLREDNRRKISGNLPGLKEAYKHLSLENYKLMKAYSDIQKQLDLMKVMSWYQKAQLEKLKQNEQFNLSNVVGLLRKELQNLEGLYFREKELADKWRNEEKIRAESSSSTWKDFKDRWNKHKSTKQYQSSTEVICMGNQDSVGETREGKIDTSESQENIDTATKRDLGKSDHTNLEDKQTSKDDENFLNDENLSMKDKEAGQSPSFFRYYQANSVEEKRRENKQHDENQTQEQKDSTEKYENLVDEEQNGQNKQNFQSPEKLQHPKIFLNQEKHPMDDMFWQHLRLANFAEDENIQDSKTYEEDLMQSAFGDSTPQTKEGITEKISLEESNEKNPQDIKDKKTKDTNNEELETSTTTNPEMTSGLLTPKEPERFPYGGDVFVMSMKPKCIDAHSSFAESVLNNSQKKISFFAAPPNGKVKYKTIAEQDRLSIVQLGSTDNLKNKVKPSIYEPTVLENGKVKVDAQPDGGKKDKQNSGCLVEDENSKYERESRYSNKMETNGQEKKENDEQRDEKSKTSGEPGDNLDKEQRENVEETTEKQESENEMPQGNQEIPLSSLAPGESYILDHKSGRIYKHTVSTHQYPMSEFETLLKQIPQKAEQVYYRFLQNTIVEKFIVKDQVVKANSDGSVAIGGDDVGPAVDANREPIQYEEDVSDIVAQLLKNPWKEGRRVPIVTKNDGKTGIVTSIYVTLKKIPVDDVISHEVLKNGKIEKIDEMMKITSYLLHENQMVRVLREDEVKHGFAEVYEPEETTNDESADKISDNDNSDFKSSHVSENDNKIFDDENEHDNSSNLGNNESNFGDVSEKDSSEASTLQQESQNKDCDLELGESGTTEYWACTAERRATFIPETIERVHPTPEYKTEDSKRLAMSSIDEEESVSHVYCQDGSVQKTWLRSKKVFRNEVPQQSLRKESNVDCKKYELDENEDLKVNQDYDNQDLSADNQEHDDIGDDDQEDCIDDDDQEDDYISDDEEYIGDDDKEHDHFGDDEEYYNDDNEHDDIDDDIRNEKHNDDHKNDNQYDYNMGHEENKYNHDYSNHVDDINNIGHEPVIQYHQQKPPEQPLAERINENRNIDKDQESIHDKEAKENVKKADYVAFIAKEWQNLKQSQQQFEHKERESPKQEQDSDQQIDQVFYEAEDDDETEGESQKRRKSRDSHLHHLMSAVWDNLQRQLVLVVKDKKQDKLKKSEATEVNKKTEYLQETSKSGKSKANCLMSAVWDNLQQGLTRFVEKEKVEDELIKTLSEEWKRLQKKQEKIKIREQKLCEKKDETELIEVSSNEDNDKDSKENIKEEIYKNFIAREWQNLKLAQQLYKPKKKQSMKLPQELDKETKQVNDEAKGEYNRVRDDLSTVKKSDEFKLHHAMPLVQGHILQALTTFFQEKEQVEDELKNILREKEDGCGKTQEELDIKERKFHERTEVYDHYGESEHHDSQISKQEIVNNFQSGLESISELPGNVHDMDVKKSNLDHFSSKSREYIEKVMNHPAHWTIKVTPRDLDQNVEDGSIEREARKMSGSSIEETSPHKLPNIDEGKPVNDFYTEGNLRNSWEMTNQHIEENLPHELPYITAEDESSDNFDKVSSEAGEMTRKPREIVQLNRPHDRPYVASTYASKYDDSMSHFLNERHTQTETVREKELSSTGNTKNVANMAPNEVSEQSEVKNERDNTNAVHKVKIPEINANIENPNVGNDQSLLFTTQWDLQIQKLREDIDRLYKETTSQKVVQPELKSSLEIRDELNTKATEPSKLNPKSESASQSKCQPKCPNAIDYETEDDKRYDTSKLNTKALKISTERSFLKKSDRVKPSETFDSTTKQPLTKRKTEENEKPKSRSLADFIEGNSYLRQRGPDEYEKKTLEFLNRPLSPAKYRMKVKKNKGIFDNESEYNEKSKRKHKKNLNKPRNGGQTQRERANAKNVPDYFPLNPQPKNKARKKPAEILKTEEVGI